MIDKEKNVQKPEEGPVTVSMARKIKPGVEKEYEAWEKAIIKEASSITGNMGTSLFKPKSTSQDKYIFISRFDSLEKAGKCEVSQSTKECREKGQPL